VGNVALLTLIMVLIANFAQESLYFRFGPREGLSIVGVEINTWTRYIYLQALLLVTQVISVLVNELSGPILGFNIYNPDKETITDFTHFELQALAQGMALVDGIRTALMIIVTISQFDIAVAKVVYSELTAIFTIFLLLKEKKFVLKGDLEAPLLDENSDSSPSEFRPYLITTTESSNKP
jgi:hypothetical protein